MSLLSPLEFRVVPAHWRDDALAIALVRRRVFLQEQGVPEDMEWESRDPDCLWFVARTRGEEGDETVGIVRLVPDGSLGRMAVLPEWRGRGIGAALLEASLARARALGWSQVRIHAQTHAMAFYAKYGFSPVGPEFEEAGIPHREMILRLEN